MGAVKTEIPVQLSFNTSSKIDFQGSRGTSDGGLILVRELDECLGFGELIEQQLTDPRGSNANRPKTRVYVPSENAKKEIPVKILQSRTHL